MLTEVPLEAYLATLDRCAEDLLWEAGVGAPPVDAFRVADRLGMAIMGDAALTTRARFARLATDTPCGGVETIVLAAEHREERRHFAVAHEIGEARASRVYESLGIDPRETDARSREAVANALAARLLLPRRWLLGIWRESDGDLFEVKTCFRTASHELIARRLLEVVSAPIVITVQDNGNVTWRRWNLPGAPPRVSELEHDCQSQSRRDAAPVWFEAQRSTSRFGGSATDLADSPETPFARIRCWPVHEPGWQREITISHLLTDEPAWL